MRLRAEQVVDKQRHWVKKMSFLGHAAADEAAARLRSRAGVLPALIVALDHWAFCRRSVKDEVGAKALTAYGITLS